MKKVILTLSLAALLAGAVSTNAYAADSTQIKSGQYVIVKEIDCTDNIDDVLNNLKDNLYLDCYTNASDIIKSIDSSNTTAPEKEITAPTNTTKPTGTTTPTDTTKPTDTTTPTKDTTTDTTDKTNLSYVEQIVSLVNQERAKAGLSAVTLETNLANAANKRAHEIESSFAHTRPNGSSFSTVLAENGVKYSGAGENIAYGQKSPTEVMNGWMNSEGHRANILNANFTTIGVGYYQNASGVNYWTQLFTY